MPIQTTAPNLLVVAAGATGGAVALRQGLLASSQLSSASTDTTVYTVAAKTSTTIATASITNATGSAVTVSVSIVPSGATVDGTHRVIAGFSLAAGDSTVLSEIAGAMIGPGDFVSMNASTAAAINYLITGTEAVTS